MICPYCRQLNPDNKHFCVRCLHELIVTSYTWGLGNNGTESPVNAAAKPQSWFPYP